MQEYKETRYSKMYSSNADLTIYSAGIEECPKGYQYGPIMRSYYMIHFVFSGEGTLTINYHEFHVQQGDIFLIPANRISLYQASSSHPWTYGWINFWGVSAPRYFQDFLHCSDDTYVIHGVAVESYRQEIEKIIHLSLSSTANFFEANSCLYHIFAKLYSELEINEEQSGNTLADAIKLYIDLNYQKDLKMTDLADVHGIHPNYMSRLFKQSFGLSPKKYLMEVKLSKAAGLLKKTSLPVSTIAISVGFPDPLAFAKVFHKAYGVSPSVYRQQAKASS